MKNLKQVSPPDALEIVFEHRNKAYGAYQLRREYNQTLYRAFGFTLLVIAFLLALPRILSAFASDIAMETSDETIYVSNGKDIPKKTEVIIPPQTKTAVTPPRATQQFTAPKVMKDDQTQDPEPNTTIDELLDNNKAIGSQNIDGSDDLPPIMEDEITVLSTKVESNAKDPEEIYDGSTVQKMPSFAGGEPELFKYIHKNIAYPAEAIEVNIEGIVVVTFIIRKDGSVADIKLLKDIGGGCGKEALRVIKSMPRWLPGEMNGMPVNVQFTMPIRFELN
jgi:protein TonB